MPSNPILTVDSLVKVFQPKGLILRKQTEPAFCAVNNISFSLYPGEIVGLLGANGSGKTTTMQMLLGTLTPTSGSIYYFGKDFLSHRSESLQHIGFASSYLKLAPRLTIYENLDIFGRLYGLNYIERNHTIQDFLKFFGMWEIRNKDLATLSAGQTTRVMLIKAFIANPKIILLDEPTASLDPDIAHEIRLFITKQQQEREISVLLASHNMDEVHQICNRVLVLRNGNIIASDTPQALAAQIKTTRLKLMIKDGMEKAISYLEQHNLPYTVNNMQLTIEINEQQVTSLLILFAKADILYVTLVIEKPSLEDYFLSIAPIRSQITNESTL